MKNKSVLEIQVLKCLHTVRTVTNEVDGETLFKESLGFESIDVIDLLFELEQEFKIRFHMRDFNDYVLAHSRLKNWDFSFQLLCDFVQTKLSEK